MLFGKKYIYVQYTSEKIKTHVVCPILILHMSGFSQVHLPVFFYACASNLAPSIEDSQPLFAIIVPYLGPTDSTVSPVPSFPPLHTTASLPLPHFPHLTGETKIVTSSPPAHLLANTSARWREMVSPVVEPPITNQNANDDDDDNTHENEEDEGDVMGER